MRHADNVGDILRGGRGLNQKMLGDAGGLPGHGYLSSLRLTASVGAPTEAKQLNAWFYPVSVHFEPTDVEHWAAKPPYVSEADARFFGLAAAKNAGAGAESGRVDGSAGVDDGIDAWSAHQQTAREAAAAAATADDWEQEGLLRDLVRYSATVSRRYSDFDWLYTQLTKTEGHPVPRLPKLAKKGFFGKAVQGTRFRAERRSALETFCRAILVQPLLREELLVKLFFGLPGDMLRRVRSQPWKKHSMTQLRSREMAAEGAAAFAVGGNQNGKKSVAAAAAASKWMRKAVESSRAKGGTPKAASGSIKVRLSWAGPEVAEEEKTLRVLGSCDAWLHFCVERAVCSQHVAALKTRAVAQKARLDGLRKRRPVQEERLRQLKNELSALARRSEAADARAAKQRLRAVREAARLEAQSGSLLLVYSDRSHDSGERDASRRELLRQRSDAKAAADRVVAYRAARDSDLSTTHDGSCARAGEERRPAVSPVARWLLDNMPARIDPRLRLPAGKLCRADRAWTEQELPGEAKRLREEATLARIELSRLLDETVHTNDLDAGLDREAVAIEDEEGALGLEEVDRDAARSVRDAKEEVVEKSLAIKETERDDRATTMATRTRKETARAESQANRCGAQARRMAAIVDRSSEMAEVGNEIIRRLDVERGRLRRQRSNARILLRFSRATEEESRNATRAARARLQEDHDNARNAWSHDQAALEADEEARVKASEAHALDVESVARGNMRTGHESVLSGTSDGMLGGTYGVGGGERGYPKRVAYEGDPRDRFMVNVFKRRGDLDDALAAHQELLDEEGSRLHEAEAVRLGQERARLEEGRLSLETEATWLKEHDEKSDEEEQLLRDAQCEYDQTREAFERPIMHALAAQEDRNKEAGDRCDARGTRCEWQEAAATRLEELYGEANTRKIATEARVNLLKSRVRTHRDLVEELKATKVRWFLAG